MLLREAKERLSKCVRRELRDHAFGDREITWMIVEGDKDVAVAGDGYLSGGGKYDGISVHEIPLSVRDPDVGSSNNSATFKGSDARELAKCGRTQIERNDSTGPNNYQDGRVSPELTLDGVREELVI